MGSVLRSELTRILKMRLRNWKETVKPTIEDTLRDVHPWTLDEPFHYYAEYGSFCWVKHEGKWRHGVVVSGQYGLDGLKIQEDGRVDRFFLVRIDRLSGSNVVQFFPIEGTMKPDTPQVQELLRQAGYFP